MFTLLFTTKTTGREEPKGKDPNSGMTEERGDVIALAGAIFLQENEKLRSVTYRQTKYCIQVRQNKNYVQVPLNPQPQAEDVLVLSRYYAKHKSGAGYEKRHQIYNIKARTQTKGQVIPKANFADQVSALEDLQHTMPFVKLIARQYKKVPSVNLYTAEQISDMQRFFCPPVTAESTVLGFDKTFNLSNVHVTVSVYKCLAEKRRSTNDHLFFVVLYYFIATVTGTRVFLFLHYSFGQLMDCPQVPILGSDDEKSLKLAMALAFPQAPRLTCTRHLRQNFCHTHADKVGLPKQERQRFITQIFGDNGIIAHGTDHMDIADRLQHMAESTENRSVQKLIELMSPLLVENAKGLVRPGLHFASPLWMNNNCDSLNHCLKQTLSWRSLKLVELVQKLHSIIKTQHGEVQRAICGVGEFVLVDEYQMRGILLWKTTKTTQEEICNHYKRMFGP
ncbi:hypothetical protein PoB_005728800 [Plakobranchus ocellatus]|uniref:MULE transposase domain-containing protein n=1 Tax=Plakobranchus ocellatus TaxID=259542 RepID=A0AAV4CGU7_9GAST|nr:hypothetical protein PoB_005728800 [Plakobranchus ocellatus]